MSLVSNAFLIFVAAALLLYYVVPKKLQWIVLLIFSYIYYLTGGTEYLFFLIFSTCITYTFALAIEKMQDRKEWAGKRKAAVVLGLICNLGMLGIVKYTNFFVDNFNALLHLELNEIEVLLPLGISFYTFQSSGYLLDVYWRKVHAEKNIFRYALFVSFFPQILQGPIGRYHHLAEQLYTPHGFSVNTLGYGLQRVIWGFCKKMIVADWAAVFVDAIWGDLDRYNGIAFFGLILYGIQLYADFSGGMDVVIGIGNMFGIQMDENFRRPYLATSMADFWKRWHMTLGEWMMNYVFYPVSLSRWMVCFSKWSKKVFGKKTGRVVPIAVADLIVFFLVGIWHGASWKYVVYGLLNGGIIAFSELMAGNYRNWKKALHISGKEHWYIFFAIVRTYILVTLRWFFDRSDSLSQGLYMVKQAFTHFEPAQILTISAGREGTAFVPFALLIIVVGCVVMVTVGCIQERGVKIRETLSKFPMPVTVAVYLLLLTAIGCFGCTASPRGFIYAQF